MKLDKNKEKEIIALLLGTPFKDSLPNTALRAYEILEKSSINIDLLKILEKIKEELVKSENIYILTGFPCNNFFETDGPLGAFILGNFLSNYHPKVSILVDKSLQEIFQRIRNSVFPSSSIKISETGLVLSFTNTLLISIEYPGMNENGYQHNMDGNRISFPLFPIEKNILKNPPRYWLAIGDGGNEIGLNALKNGFYQAFPDNKTCKCGCGGSIVPISKADAVLLGFTSNFASIGFALLLSIHLRDHLFSFQEKFSLILVELNKNHIFDGITGNRNSVDGIPFETLHHYYNYLVNYFRTPKPS